MASTSKDLGIATAYGYAKSKGYLGTEEEFATLMASYATVAQTAVDAKDDAEDARDDAVAAKQAAEAAAATCAPLAEAFSESTAYAAGDYAVYGGKLYRFTTAHAAGAWVGTDAEEATLTEDVTSLNQAINLLETRLKSGLEADAELHLGLYIDADGDIAQVEED